MAINNYNDFLKIYEKPSVDGVIVGFSGIDPQKKTSGSGMGGGCDCDNTTLTDEQKAIVDEKINEKIHELETRIGGGNVDPKEIDHEVLKRLYGGDVLGHYHLTEYEWVRLGKMISILFPNGETEPIFPSDIENKLKRETWTFVLEDDTTYQRDVAIWN